MRAHLVAAWCKRALDAAKSARARGVWFPRLVITALAVGMALGRPIFYREHRPDLRRVRQWYLSARSSHALVKNGDDAAFVGELAHLRVPITTARGLGIIVAKLGIPTKTRPHGARETASATTTAGA